MTDAEPAKALEEWGGHGDVASLAGLADTANSHHEQLGLGLRACFEHAIAAGEALLEAQRAVGRGEWRGWVAANLHFGQRHAAMYMRAAFYKKDLREMPIAVEATSDRQVRDALSWLPPRPATWAHRRVTPELREHARRLHKEGLTWREVGRRLGAHHETVHGWADPAYEQHVRELAKKTTKASQTRYRQRQRLLDEVEARQAKDELARTAGGNIEQAYSLVRKALSVLDKCLVEADGEYRAHLVEAMQKCHRAEDAIVAGLRSKRARPTEEQP